MATLASVRPAAPEPAITPARGRAAIVLATSGVIPLFGLLQQPPQTTLLIYTLFALALLARPYLRRRFERMAIPTPVLFAATMLLVGWIAEVCAWFNEYAARKTHPALFHPQLGPDLILVSGLFLGWAAGWLAALNRYRFGLREVFVTTGVLGVGIEQDGAVLSAVLQMLGVNPLHSLLMAVFVFLVYGSITALAFAVVESRLTPPVRDTWWKYPIACLLLYLGGKAGAWLVRVCADALGLIATPRPIGA
jgi:hypothetical protein